MPIHKWKKNRIQLEERIPYSQLEIMIETVSLFSLFLIIVFTVVYWPRLPEQIPSHFGGSGLPDDYDSKSFLFFMPGIGLFLYALLTVVSQFPQSFNLPWTITEENAVRQYQIARKMIGFLKLEMIWLFGYIEFGTIQVALGNMSGLGVAFLPLSLAIIFGSMFVCLIQGFLAR